MTAENIHEESQFSILYWKDAASGSTLGHRLNLFGTCISKAISYLTIIYEKFLLCQYALENIVFGSKNNEIATTKEE